MKKKKIGKKKVVDFAHKCGSLDAEVFNNN